jgi:hypothetical protein
MKNFYDIYKNFKNDTVQYNRIYRWFSFYNDNCVHVTRKVYKCKKTNMYYIHYKNQKMVLPVYVLNEKLTSASNPIIEF